MAGKKILIADDEKDALLILEKNLRKSGYEVFAVAEGREVVNKCNSAQPDLILLDIAMPGMDGYSIAFKLRQLKAFENIPIIFMTAKELDYSGIQKRLDELGNCDFLPKPFPFAELLSKIKETIG